ncbi:MAG TPA: T9SS type A sorting domain-containing protein [Rhodothermales bacterium]|nr:T9SS type A sorting domain-containing protein [Rhodothermales bacterium]
MFCKAPLYSLGILAAFSSTALAQEKSTVFLDSTAQVIRGFGAANIVTWRPDMTEGEMETAFGVGEGQLGFSILRLRIAPNQNQWSVNLPSARRANEMGVTIIGSPWSPPASMKTNNNLIGGELRDDMFDDYAAHLDAFNTYMDNEGVPIYAVSVQNEPDIQVSYESCDWSPEAMRKFMAENAGSIGTRVIAPESFQFRKQMSDPILNDSAATANLDILGGHIYGGGLASYPLAEEKGKELWMTEHLVLETDLEANIGTAYEIQRVMKAGMSAYIWWYIVRFYGPIADDENEDYRKGEITKRGYMMSQFSRFIRPGFVRIHTQGPDLRSGVSTTAYRDSSNVVIVAINTSESSKEVSFTLDGGSAGPLKRYVTSETQDVEELGPVEVSQGGFTVTLGPNSATTFVADYSAVSSENDAVPGSSSQLLQNYPNPFRSLTTIGYNVPQAGEVTLEVFDLLGRKVRTLESGFLSAGRREVAFEASGLSPGMYVFQLSVGDSVETRMMTLVE